MKVHPIVILFGLLALITVLIVGAVIILVYQGKIPIQNPPSNWDWFHNNPLGHPP